MSKLQELIDRLCPDGVEFKPLGEVSTYVRGVTYNKHQESKTPETPSWNILRANNITLFSNTINFEDVKRVKQEVKIKDSQWLKANDILICAGSGSKEHVGKVAFINEDIPYSFGGFMAVIRASKVLNSRFLYFILTSNQFSNYLNTALNSTTINNLNSSIMNAFTIPVPPIAVQDEIVKILDRFADYAAELQAELQARKEQYEYYRNLLLTFNSSAYGCGTDDAQKISVIARGGHSYEIQWKTMGEIGTFIRGNGLQKKDFTESGVGCIHYGQIYTHYGTFADKTKSFVTEGLAKKLLEVENGDIVLACTSENIEDVAKAVAWLGKETIVTGGHSVVFKHNQNPKYIAYFMQTALFFNQKKKYAYGAKVIDIKSEDLAKILIPIPPLELQEKIVAILDRFETLVNDLSKGLPAEIEAVKARYEYYRNKLLGFKEKPA